MLKRNLISIIIPVYNASAFISNTIDNLLAQEVEKELLLVNDGSTDNSLNILNDYAQKYSSSNPQLSSSASFLRLNVLSSLN